MCNHQLLALIPARGGSKIIPHKNIRPLAGKPLITWTIETALACPMLDRVIVSTDDQNIAEIARQYGVEVPFIRPAELGQDDTPGIEPVLHAVHWLDEQEDYRPDCVIILQPTSPFRTQEDIEAAVKLAQERQADAVVSVCLAHHHPYWMRRITEDGRLADFLSLDRVYTRRQDLSPVYVLNGAIYLVRREVLLERRTFYTDRTYAYVMLPDRSLDIDTPWDFYLADLILTEKMRRERL